MPSINLPGSKYTAPPTIQGWHWKPYSNPAYLSTLKSAILLIDMKIRQYTPCNDAFKKLPGGKSFAQVWNDKSIWISFDPDISGNKWGVTLNAKHVSLTAYALKMGKWTTAATLVHELAHVNGAGSNNTAAEDTLKSCLLKSLHNPNIIGSLMKSKLINKSLTA